MMPTNSKWAVPVEAKDRRYFILDVSDKHKEDSAYFAAIDDQMKEGGAAAFLRDLLARGMTFRRMKPAPMTEAKREQILHSLKPEEKWLKSVLTEGQFPVRAEKMMDTPTDWPEPGGAVPKSAVLASFQAYVPGVKGPATPEGLTLFLERYLGKIPKSKPTILGKRTHCYILPPLAEARAAFLRVIPHVEFEAEVDEPDGDSGGTERVVRMRRRGGRF
jgi:hypothetical protein